MKIVVIGGTGLIGSKTAAILRQRENEVVAASPKMGVNTITGEGLKEAITMKIVVIGGTGLIGSKTVAILRQGGHEVVAASPKSGINSITGEGLTEAMVSDRPRQFALI